MNHHGKAAHSGNVFLSTKIILPSSSIKTISTTKLGVFLSALNISLSL
ncbi:MAG: hypothetical protein WCG25_01475 [bacterium]